ncbi:MAG: nucleotidyltransferase domain-containing protein [Candidatus Altiarchaeales archaeon HGW-Altiarchaeales-1]|nr:MAG: nucleotidyltransferase domain-containing protein [Candidatus Altiarchaeales archaeon HGW-Altiarchaeales-1]
MPFIREKMKNHNEIIKTAKRIITCEIEKWGLNMEKIYLFGSRARGDFGGDSDWDFYIILREDMNFAKKRKIITQIKRKLIEAKIPNDILLQSKSVVENRIKDVGYLIYYVIKEGVEI